MILPIILVVFASIFVLAALGLLIARRQPRDRSSQSGTGANRYRRTNQNKRSRHVEPHLDNEPAQEQKLYSRKTAKKFKKQPRVEPQTNDLLAEDVLQEQRQHVDHDDADVILGLKAAPEKTATAAAQPSPQQEPAAPKLKMILLHVFAEEKRPFAGYELLQTLLSTGLRYGKMNIFHRHVHKTGRGPVLFSLASAVEPGTFDLPKMGNFKCPGLVLFMDLTQVAQPLEAFNLMIETAGTLVEELGGRVMDSQHNTLTKERVIKIRQDIRDFEQSQRIPDLFEA